jgi:aryl-alcohol dehydrogenase-like predicted oxidoreductase
MSTATAAASESWGSSSKSARASACMSPRSSGKRAPLDLANYPAAAFRGWIDDCREDHQVDRLDLVQLHCLPTPIYYRPDLFAAMDEMVEAGAIAHYGVSVERVEEGLKAIEFPGVASVQLVFNVLRQRPTDGFFGEAAKRDVGIIARAPLASGLLTGKFTSSTTFDPTDHRNLQPPWRRVRRRRDLR